MSEIQNTSRITGMVSGFDTDSKIKDLMVAERFRLDKVEQQKTWVEWQQDAYREQVTAINSFKSEYFDILNPESNFRSPSMFAEFGSTVQLAGVSTSVVSVQGISQMSDYTHEISSITQLATADTWEGAVQSATIDGSGLNLANLETTIAGGDDTVTFNLDGVNKAIDLTGGYGGDVNNLVADLQGQLDSVYGAGKITVSNNGGEIRFSPEAGHTVKIFETDANVLTNMGFTNGAKNYVDTTATLADEFGMAASTAVNFEINGVSNFGITTDDTIADMITKVNSSTAGVTLSYNALQNRFVMVSNDTGVANNISLTDTDSFFANELKITGQTTAGQDAQFTLDGVTTSRSSNTFTVDGGEYTLNSTYDGASGDIKIDFTTDTDALVDKIKEFVDTYNGLIKEINERSEEKRYYGYKPLTDSQKEDMSDEEIELWNEKAKSGLLSGDTLLESMTSQLRTALYEEVDGLNFTLKEMGITTSVNYKDKGKLEVNEEQLRTAINNDYNEVVSLFTKTSDIEYNDTANRSQRMDEQGLANRLYDILQDFTRTTRDNDGKKGIFVEKAGVESDTSDFNNVLSKQLDDYDDRIRDLEDYLAEKEEYYYKMFAAMEKAMSKMESQSSMLMQQM